MRKHCEIGYNMLIRIPFLRDAAEIVLAHQEFFDGSGYPRGLKGEQIPLGAAHLYDCGFAGRDDQRPAVSQEHCRFLMRVKKFGAAPARSSIRRWSKCSCRFRKNTGSSFAKIWVAVPAGSPA